MRQSRCNAAAVTLFVLGFFGAVVQRPLRLDAVGFGTPFELSTVAANLAASGEFRDPFGIATGPTAHVTPIYTFILAAIIRIVKQPEAVVWCMILFNAALHGLLAAMLAWLSQKLYGRLIPGIAGGILLILTARLMPQWEVALAAVLLLLATRAILDRRAIAAGFWCGFAILTSPLSLPVLLLLQISKGRRFLAVSSMLALVLCTPWIVRNWIVMGAPYFIRDNFGLELYISNNDKSAPDLVQNAALWTMHPNQNAGEAAVVANMGEGAYNRMRLHDAVDWMRSHPRRLVQLTLGRVLCYWLPPLSEGWPSYGSWLITVLGFAGVWMARRHRVTLLLAAAALVWELPFLLIQTVGRYRFPSLWIWALLAGYAIDRWLTLVNHHRLTIRVLSPLPSDARVIAGR
jgi:hypothetical protein